MKTAEKPAVKTNGNGSTLPTIPECLTPRAIADAVYKDEQFSQKCSALYLEGRLTQAIQKSRIPVRSLPYRVRVMLSEEKEAATKVRLSIDIPAWMFGMFAVAAKIHGLETWEEAAYLYLDSNVTDWSNEGYHLEE